MPETRSIEWVLSYTKSTKGTHVYSDDSFHTVYIKKDEMSSPYPTQVKVEVTWTR